ncbi:hypothetical protein PN465_07105 [Nodularia spumigena CS-584]|jgi:hypothetical protein|uniref:Uncharacterized protein n=1 Tax=Nodularia spumigena UHCC 0060 TaxID=3110300 RepID=A0ABU5UKM8_NODSP|nr:hypothetical protein [Nodularia spumigena]AHJ27491.1 hypothetical protein NSP_11500 [Nodularia spumigena CCY9414]EAW44830.1 hypothetical protein N9414_16499 [Nodularia spumigena CCY9414]MDB9381989.1 hypothetical protein [Nodularia spumigena CS-584]MEA5525685.1 hypothetical protein [Nodularia spumigena UHCC 0143]MEA5557303.1 hypothetical protein [Nodularia spumigena CH309]
MKIKGIKRKNTIELFQEIKIPDGQQIVIEIIQEEPKKNGISESQFWQSLENFRQEQELEIEPEVFANVRDTSPGREVNW